MNQFHYLQKKSKSFPETSCLQPWEGLWNYSMEIYLNNKL